MRLVCGVRGEVVRVWEEVEETVRARMKRKGVM